MAIITPFNFPLEIPALQVMWVLLKISSHLLLGLLNLTRLRLVEQALGALFMGNRPLLKSDLKACVVFV